MKRSKIKILLAATIFMSGCLLSLFPDVSAAGEKILVTDNDMDGAISIGDEFCLGEECFYVIANDGDDIKALTKYNLNTGFNIIKISDELVDEIGSNYRATFEHGYIYCGYNSRFDFNYCLEPIDFTIEEIEMPEERYRWDDLRNCISYDYTEYRYVDGSYYYYGVTCLGARDKGNKILQSPLAISKHGGNKEIGSEYPEVGDYFFNDYMNNYRGTPEENIALRYNSDNELIKDNYVFNYIDEYKDNLNELGVGEVSDINFLNYNDFADVLTAINPDEITFKHNGYYCEGDWVENDDGTWSCPDADYPYVWTLEDEGLYDVNVGRSGIKQYIPEQYSWLYSTTYWLGTTYYTHYGNPEGDNYDYELYYNYHFFIDTVGDLCYVNGQNGCKEPSIGAGLRPVVTMAEDQFELNSMNIAGTVRWEDDDNSSNTRPNKVTIRLLRNGVAVDSVEATLEQDDTGNVWRFAFAAVPKYDENGEPFVYTIMQDDVNGYSSEITIFDVVNEYRPAGGDTVPDVPKTNDNVMAWIASFCGMVGLAGTAFAMNKKSR